MAEALHLKLDGVTIDRSNQVIVVRFQLRVHLSREIPEAWNAGRRVFG